MLPYLKTQKQEETKPKMPFGAFPNIEQLVQDEKYWALRDVMDRIAEQHGIQFVQFAIQFQNALISMRSPSPGSSESC